MLNFNDKCTEWRHHCFTDIFLVRLEENNLLSSVQCLTYWPQKCSRDVFRTLQTFLLELFCRVNYLVRFCFCYGVVYSRLLGKVHEKDDQICNFLKFKFSLKSCLTHYSPVLLIYTPWKYQKTWRFSYVFRG